TRHRSAVICGELAADNWSLPVPDAHRPHQPLAARGPLGLLAFPPELAPRCLGFSALQGGRAWSHDPHCQLGSDRGSLVRGLNSAADGVCPERPHMGGIDMEDLSLAAPVPIAG